MKACSASIAALVLLGGCSFIDDFGSFTTSPDLDAGIDGGDQVDAGPGVDGCAPGPELCNSMDDDCDGVVDEEVTDCSFPNATGVCAAGACTLGACDTSYGDCNAEPGCETELNTREQCGGCGITCGVDELCGSAGCATPSVDWVVVASSASFPRPAALGVDAMGNAYFGGTFTGALTVEGTAAPTSGTAGDAYVASVDPSGALRWVQSIGGAGAERLTDLAVTPLGIVYAVGSANSSITVAGSTNNATDDGFVWSLAPDGSSRWLRLVSSINADSLVNGVALEPSGDIVITGAYEGTIRGVPSNGQDLFVGRMSTTGVQEDHYGFGGPGSQRGTSISVGAGGNLYVTGAFSATVDWGGGSRVAVDGEEVVLLSLGLDNAYLRDLSLVGNDDESGVSVATDSVGNVYWHVASLNAFDYGGGLLPHPTGNYTSHLASVATDGTHRWSFISELSTGGRVRAFADVPWFAGAGGAVELLGTTLSSVGSTDALAAQLDDTGGLTFYVSLGSVGGDQAADVHVEGDGIWMLGTFGDVIDFGGDIRSPAGSSDTFLARLVAP